MPELENRPDIDDLVRQSLRQRAEDVEPTPALWQEVDRRVSRRRRWLVLSWSLAGVTAALAALVIVPGLLDTGADPGRVPEIAPLERTPAQEPEEDPGTAPDSIPQPPVGADDAGESEPEVPSGESGVDLGDGMVVADGPELLLVGPDGSTETLYTFPSEGHSTIWGLSVRPGSTPDDLTVALLTQAEGMYDVRWLRAVDGETDGSHLFDFPEAQLATGVDLGSMPAPVWSPEGDLLAFVNALQGGGSELWVIGWDENEPTDDPNRAVTQFSLETDVPLRAEQWVWTDDAEGVARQGELLLTAVEEDGAYALPLERQADAAVALAADVELESRGWEGVLDLGRRGDGVAPDTLLVPAEQAGGGASLAVLYGDGAGDGSEFEHEVPVPASVSEAGGRPWLAIGGGVVVVGSGDAFSPGPIAVLDEEQSALVPLTLSGLESVVVGDPIP